MSASALVLAAGEGTRMKSSLPKVAHEILGVPLVRYVVDAARAGGCERVVVVTGHGADVVEALLGGEVCVRQEQQLGTGHAVMCAEPALGVPEGSLVVLSGDSPLMRPETIARLIEARESTGAAVVVLTTELEDPAGYGRIIRDEAGALAHIVEDKDLATGQRAIREVNTGTYCFDAPVLFAHLHRLDNSNSQGEFYLTDMVRVLRDEGLRVTDVVSDDPSETLGVNTRVQLADAAAIMQQRINRAHLLAGVTMTSPDLVWIAPTVRLGRDVVLEPMTFLLGETEVAEDCRIGPGARVSDSRIASGAVIDASVVAGADVGPAVRIGPYASVGPGSVVAGHVTIGACVEVKESTLGEDSVVQHLSYLGDATIGAHVTIGAGTITCNHDGRRRHRTTIGDGAFIGSDTMLVAPVTIGSGAITGAGSVISNDVPADALAVERAEQKTVEGWAAWRRAADEDDEA